MLSTQLVIPNLHIFKGGEGQNNLRDEVRSKKIIEITVNVQLL